MPYLQFIKAYLHARRLNISRKTSFKHAKSFITLNDEVKLTVIIIVALIAVILHYKYKIDGHSEVVARLNSIIKHEHRQAVKNELYVVALLNGRIKIDGKVASFCQKDVVGNCKG
jgi:hypothetical protein